MQTNLKPVNLLHQSAMEMASAIRLKQISSFDLVTAHLEQIQRVNPLINAVVEILAESALEAARQADKALASGKECGPLHGVPISIKDSIDVRGVRTTAGTWGRRNAPVAARDATVVRRLRNAGAIPIAKTNLPDLLFAYESDNLIFGRTNNPYDLERTPGGSSGGESALIAACGSPLGLGSDAAGSVRVPAAFCGIASIKPTSGRLPRTGHVPSAAGWIEALWQIGPMARRVDDLVLALEIMCGEDGEDFTSPPAGFVPAKTGRLRVALFTDNGIAPCSHEVVKALRDCANGAECFMDIVEARPPGMDKAYELEMSLLGADGGDGIDAYLKDASSTHTHPLLEAGFLSRMRPFRCSATELAKLWAGWDEYRAGISKFFQEYDAVLCPAYTQTALKHGDSAKPGNFEGFSYTMAWNVSGNPAATVCVSNAHGLPINIQVTTAKWREMLALQICRMLEERSGWSPPPLRGAT
ncbi:MAG TPA: amidase [Bryobacteraceae bacterium]|nr:amidase [Bryobacteraceae bacterium]